LTRGVGIRKELLKAINETTSGIAKDKELKGRQALWAVYSWLLGVA